MDLHVLTLAGVVAVAIASGAAARRLGQPAILGELVAGIIVGPALLGLFEPDVALSIIGQLGVVLLMFYIGLHLDLDDMRRASNAGLLSALGGFVVPAAAGFFVMRWFGSDLTEALFVALAMGVTALATKSRILLDLELLTTRIGHVLMAGAVYADVAAVVLFTALLGAAASGSIRLSVVSAVGAEAAAFLAISAAIGIFVIPALSRRLGTDRVSAGTRFTIVMFVALAFGGAAEFAGLHAILGTFFAGLFFGAGGLPHHARQELQKAAHSISIGFLAPVFFVVAG
ncbi:MAG: cation:proton antiporter, partial [Acidimicrobiia bacterium]|nr:cation:proton antiporter [Acidimicrobiia bacterium]